jgi:hypothetical protein
MQTSLNKWLGLIAALGTLSLATQSMAADATPCSRPTTPAEPIVSFTPKSSIQRGFFVQAQVAGSKAHIFQIDTGSDRILVPLSILPAKVQEAAKRGTIESFGYMSSGNQYKGYWVDAEVKLLGGAAPVVAQLPVFAVAQPSFTGGMMGIRFDVGDPAHNVLMNVIGADKQKINSGYIIWPHCIQVGVTPEKTQGFDFIKLTQKGDGHWDQPLGKVTLPEVGYTLEKPVLMDTGLTHMLLMVKDHPLPKQLQPLSDLPAGTSVTVTIPPASAKTKPLFSYTFKSKGPGPGSVRVRSDVAGINTGILPFGEWAYAFDNKEGRLGFKHVDSTP